MLSLVDEVVRLQPVQQAAEVAFEGHRYGHIHVIVPEDQAVVTPRPQQRAPVQEEGHSGLGQRVGEHIQRVHQQLQLLVPQPRLELPDVIPARAHVQPDEEQEEEEEEGQAKDERLSAAQDSQFWAPFGRSARAADTGQPLGSDWFHIKGGGCHWSGRSAVTGQVGCHRSAVTGQVDWPS